MKFFDDMTITGRVAFAGSRLISVLGAVAGCTVSVVVSEPVLPQPASSDGRSGDQGGENWTTDAHGRLKPTG